MVMSEACAWASSRLRGLTSWAACGSLLAVDLMRDYGNVIHDMEIPEHELHKTARAMVGGMALEHAERELEQAKQQHYRAERELDHHRIEAGYRRGLERAFYAFTDLNREKRLNTHERQTALELE